MQHMLNVVRVTHEVQYLGTHSKSGNVPKFIPETHNKAKPITPNLIKLADPRMTSGTWGNFPSTTMHRSGLKGCRFQGTVSLSGHVRSSAVFHRPNSH